MELKLFQNYEKISGPLLTELVSSNLQSQHFIKDHYFKHLMQRIPRDLQNATTLYQRLLVTHHLYIFQWDNCFRRHYFAIVSHFTLWQLQRRVWLKIFYLLTSNSLPNLFKILKPIPNAKPNVFHNIFKLSSIETHILEQPELTWNSARLLTNIELIKCP